MRRWTVPFNLDDFLSHVETDVADAFLKRHGNGIEVDWQQGRAARARAFIAALADNDWAASALESCELIATSAGRVLLMTAGDYDPSLAVGVEDLDKNDETFALWLATNNRDVFDRVVSAAHARKGLGTRSWDAFSIASREPVRAMIHDDEQMQQFRTAVEHVLLSRRYRGVPALRSVRVDHFEYSLERQTTHSLRALAQVNVYGETSPRIHETLIAGELSRRQLPGLYRAALVFDQGRQLLEVVTVGGRPIRDALVEAFQRTLLPEEVTRDRLVKRAINFKLFNSRPRFDIRPDDPISAWDVDEIRMFPPGSEAGLITLECKRDGRLVRDVYRSAEVWFGGESPIGKDGWTIAGVRLRLTFKPERTGRRSCVVTVDLRAPYSTTLREKTNADHAAAEKLFRRWGIFGPDFDDE
jgi:hypothetical protein